MNNRKVGKFAVTAIVGLLSAITGIASVEMLNSLKKETGMGSGADCGEHEEKEKDENK